SWGCLPNKKHVVQPNPLNLGFLVQSSPHPTSPRWGEGLDTISRDYLTGVLGAVGTPPAAVPLELAVVTWSHSNVLRDTWSPMSPTAFCLLHTANTSRHCMGKWATALYLNCERGTCFHKKGGFILSFSPHILVARQVHIY